MSYNWLGWLSLLEGDLDKAVSYFQKAYELDPLAMGYKVQIARAYYHYRQYDKALQLISKVLAVNPGYNFGLWHKANVLTAQGKYQEAIETFHERTVSIRTNWALGYTHGMAGKRDEAREILDYQLKKRENQYVPPFMIGVIYISLGEKEKALDWMEKAYEEGSGLPFMFGMKYDQMVDPLREDPRFKELYAKMNFAE